MNAVLKHKPKQLRINTSCELIVDLFVGGGGASLGMCGNSVCPQVAAAIVAANYREIELGMVA